MKKQVKKLKLAKETVRNLETNDYRRVVGGDIYYQEQQVRRDGDYSTWFTLCETGCCTISACVC